MRTHWLYSYITNLCRKPFPLGRCGTIDTNIGLYILSSSFPLCRYGPNEFVSPAGTVCADVCGQHTLPGGDPKAHTDLECCETGWKPIAQGDVVRRIRCGMGEKTCAPAALVVSSDVKYDKYWFEISLNTSGVEDTNATRSR